VGASHAEQIERRRDGGIQWLTRITLLQSLRHTRLPRLADITRLLLLLLLLLRAFIPQNQQQIAPRLQPLHRHINSASTFFMSVQL